jgi:TolB protein
MAQNVGSIDGRNHRQLTNIVSAQTRYAWSPDGKRIAFVAKGPGKDNIFYINADGTGLGTLSDSVGPDCGPAWTPDGTRMVFLSERDGHAQAYSINLDGSGTMNLSNSATNDTYERIVEVR